MLSVPDRSNYGHLPAHREKANPEETDTWQEKDTNRLDLSDASEDTVPRLLLFLYTGGYDDFKAPRIGNEIDGTSDLLETSFDTVKNSVSLNRVKNPSIISIIKNY